MITYVASDQPVGPRIMRMETTDLIATVQTAGYLNLVSNWVQANNAGMTWKTTDIVKIELTNPTTGAVTLSADQAVAIDAAGKITLSDA